MHTPALADELAPGSSREIRPYFAVAVSRVSSAKRPLMLLQENIGFIKRDELGARSIWHNKPPPHEELARSELSRRESPPGE